MNSKRIIISLGGSLLVPDAIDTTFVQKFKDFIVKSKTMAGFDTEFVPGWDTHGLPIELAVERELGAGRRDMTLRPRR